MTVNISDKSNLPTVQGSLRASEPIDDTNLPSGANAAEASRRRQLPVDSQTERTPHQPPGPSGIWNTNLDSVIRFIDYIKELLGEKTPENPGKQPTECPYKDPSVKNAQPIEEEYEVPLEDCMCPSENTSIEGKSAVNNVFSKLLRPDKQGNISEGQAMHGVVVALLRESQDQDPSLAKMYRAGYRKLRRQGLNPEQAIHGSLTQLVKAGKLERAEARSIAGVAQKASQLDNRGETISNKQVIPLDQAIATAERQLEAITSGEVDAPEIRLKRKFSREVNVGESPAPSVTAELSGGFLWKPESESDGNLVVLLPESLRGNISSVALHSSLPATNDNRIEIGRFSGDTHNGNRSHFRFQRNGGRYPDNSQLVVTLNDGRVIYQTITRPGDRLEK